MSDPLDIIVAFVEGRMTPADFHKRLYTDGGLEAFLMAPGVHPPEYVGAGTFFHFLLECDVEDPNNMLNAEKLYRFLLDARGVSYVPSHAAYELFDALLRAQPKWLDVRTAWLAAELLPHAEGRSGKALVTWLREQLLQRFRYLKRPPRWIQAAKWPIGPNGPLVFLGEVPVRDYFHDDGAVFVFHDPSTGRIETVTQVM